MQLRFMLIGQKRQLPDLVCCRKTDGLLDSCRSPWPCPANASDASRRQELVVPLDRIHSLVAVYQALTKERIAGVIQCERMKVQRELACPVQRLYLSDRHCVHGLGGTASWVLMQACACR